MIRITKEFSFEMAHALLGHDGPCRNIHGHSYRMSVTLRGKPVNEPGNPKDGMLVDFSELKKLVGNHIINIYDHALVLNSREGRAMLEELKGQRLILFDFQPTCENLTIAFANSIRQHLPEGVELYKLQLHETSTSSAEWCAEDYK